MEFICLENNQVGQAGGYVPGTGTSNTTDPKTNK